MLRKCSILRQNKAKDIFSAAEVIVNVLLIFRERTCSSSMRCAMTTINKNMIGHGSATNRHPWVVQYRILGYQLRKLKR